MIYEAKVSSSDSSKEINVLKLLESSVGQVKKLLLRISS